MSTYSRIYWPPKKFANYKKIPKTREYSLATKHERLRFIYKLFYYSPIFLSYCTTQQIIDEKVLCMHGGLSPELHSMEQIRKIIRPTDVPDTGLICDLLWSDPEEYIEGWGENDRGVSFTFGGDIVEKFLRKHDLDLICRAHQVWVDCVYSLRIFCQIIGGKKCNKNNKTYILELFYTT